LLTPWAIAAGQTLPLRSVSGCVVNFRKKGCKIAGRSEGGRNETRRIAARMERDERRDSGGGSAMAGGTSTGDDERDRG